VVITPDNIPLSEPTPLAAVTATPATPIGIACTDARVLHFIEAATAPNTRRAYDGDLVAGVREAIESHGATLVYLPPYSPDLNPIEQAFAKLKALLRNIAARTVAWLWDAVGDQLDRFTPQECVNYLTNAGYVPLVRDTL